MRREQITDAMREAMADVGDPLPDLADLASRNRIPPEHRDSRPRPSAWGPGSIEANERRMFSANAYDPDYATKQAPRTWGRFAEPDPEPVRLEKCSCGRVLQRGAECDCRPTYGPATPNVVERSIEWFQKYYGEHLADMAERWERLYLNRPPVHQRPPAHVLLRGRQPHFIVVDDLQGPPMTNAERARNQEWFDRVARPRIEAGTVRVGGWRVPVLQPDPWADPAEEVKPSLIATNTTVGGPPITPQMITDVVERTRAQLGHPTPANRAGRRSRPGPIDI